MKNIKNFKNTFNRLKFWFALCIPIFLIGTIYNINISKHFHNAKTIDHIVKQIECNKQYLKCYYGKIIFSYDIDSKIKTCVSNIKHYSTNKNNVTNYLFKYYPINSTIKIFNDGTKCITYD